MVLVQFPFNTPAGAGKWALRWAFSVAGCGRRERVRGCSSAREGVPCRSGTGYLAGTYPSGLASSRSAFPRDADWLCGTDLAACSCHCPRALLYSHPGDSFVSFVEFPHDICRVGRQSVTLVRKSDREAVVEIYETFMPVTLNVADSSVLLGRKLLLRL